jgi:small-conductance mechanosensitive channel
VRVSVGIGYGDAAELARDVILRTLAAVEGVEKSPPPLVYVAELAPSAVVLHVYFWTGSEQSNVLRTTDAVSTKLKEALMAEGIDIPFPHTVVLFRDETRSARRRRAVPRQSERMAVDDVDAERE